MTQSSLNKLVKYLKIATWVFILATAFTFYLGLRTFVREDKELYTFVSVGILSVGYLCNFLSKRLPTMVKTKENE